MIENIEDQITLEYCGEAATAGRMNADDVASYIIAFSDFLGVTSRKTYGEKVELKTDIQGFRNNSFDIDFIFKAFCPREIILTISSSL